MHERAIPFLPSAGFIPMDGSEGIFFKVYTGLQHRSEILWVTHTVLLPLPVIHYSFLFIQDFIHTLTSLAAVNKVSNRSVQIQDNVDCAEVHPFQPEAYRQGLETGYKPARFGRQSGHSGWGVSHKILTA